MDLSASKALVKITVFMTTAIDEQIIRAIFQCTRREMQHVVKSYPNCRHSTKSFFLYILFDTPSDFCLLSLMILRLNNKHEISILENNMAFLP